MEESSAPESAKPEVKPNPAIKPPAKPERKPERKPEPEPIPTSVPQRKLKPDPRPGKGTKTVASAGQTQHITKPVSSRDSSPVPSPSKEDFENLHDPSDQGGGIDDSQTLIGPISNSEESISEDMWNSILESSEQTVSPTSSKPKPPGKNAAAPPKKPAPPANPPGTGSQSGEGSSILSGSYTGDMARCTNCHAAVQFLHDEDLQDLLCPRCGLRCCLIHPETPSADITTPPQVGTYAIQKRNRIGVGSFGNVYRATDGENQNQIAIKVFRADRVPKIDLNKYLATLRSGMQLQHPNIAKLYEVESEKGRIYLVSQYVNGLDLSEYLLKSSDWSLSIREAASIAAVIASGLHHAHKFYVYHGNLKPTNIRLDADRKAYLMDFGLNSHREKIQVTGNGRIVGTAAYMAPEQLTDSPPEPDALTDVYSLGVILYEMLTGQKPFPGNGQDLLKQIAKATPPPPRSINSKIPKPLDIICMKCLELHPKDRYQSANDVSRELRLYLQDKPIHTKPPGMLTRFGRWCRRRPIMVGMLLTFFFLAIVGVGLLSLSESFSFGDLGGL